MISRATFLLNTQSLYGMLTRKWYGSREVLRRMEHASLIFATVDLLFEVSSLEAARRSNAISLSSDGW